MAWDFCSRICRDESGTAAIEYGLVATLIAVALVGAMVSLGDEVDTQYQTVETKYKDAANG